MKNRIIFGKPDIKSKDIIAVTEVLKGGWIGMGGVTQLLEHAFVKFTGAKYAVAVSSGSAGLFLSMLACGIGDGDEVITSPLTFPATANEIIHTGAEVRFVDVQDDVLYIPTLHELHRRIEAALNELKQELVLVSKN